MQTSNTSLYRLLRYLMDQLDYYYDQKKYGNPGVVVTRRNVLLDLKLTEQELDLMIYRLENWSDFKKQPSLTCLFRIPIGYGGKVTYGDYHTLLSELVPQVKIQRHMLEFLVVDGVRGVYPIEGSGLDPKTKIDYGTDVNELIALHGEAGLERNKLYQFYERLFTECN